MYTLLGGDAWFAAKTAVRFLSCFGSRMAFRQQALKYGQRRIMARIARSIPWVGAAVALLAVGSAIRRKGVLGGTLDTALNAIPFVGAVKNTAELVRGRDFIRDRASSS